jgi:hypothetical protein
MADLVVCGSELQALAERVQQCGRALAILTASLPPLGDPVLDDAAARCAGTILAAVDAVGAGLSAQAGTARTAVAAYRHTDAVLARQANASAGGARVRAE